MGGIFGDIMEKPVDADHWKALTPMIWYA